MATLTFIGTRSKCKSISIPDLFPHLLQRVLTSFLRKIYLYEPTIRRNIFDHPVSQEVKRISIRGQSCSYVFYYQPHILGGEDGEGGGQVGDGEPVL